MVFFSGKAAGLAVLEQKKGEDTQQEKEDQDKSCESGEELEVVNERCDALKEIGGAGYSRESEQNKASKKK